MSDTRPGRGRVVLGSVTTQPYRPRELGERPLSCAPMAYTEISYEERDDHVGLLTIQRPDARNALTFTTYAEMEEVVRTTTARCLVITGADPAFCSGDDVKQVMAGAGERVSSGLRAEPAIPPLADDPLPPAAPALPTVTPRQPVCRESEGH